MVLLMFILASFKCVAFWFSRIRMHTTNSKFVTGCVTTNKCSCGDLSFRLIYLSQSLWYIAFILWRLCPWYKWPTAPSFLNNFNFLMVLPHLGFQWALTDQRRPLLASLHDFNWAIKSHWSTFGLFWSDSFKLLNLWLFLASIMLDILYFCTLVLDKTLI